MVTTISRDEFITRRFDHKPGNNVTVLGHNGSGKTVLAYQLLESVISPDLPAWSLVMKPEDPEVVRWGKALNLPRAKTWPSLSRRLPWRARTNGHTIWPVLGDDPLGEDERLYWTMRAALSDGYRRKGHRIIFADELAGLTHDTEVPKGEPPLERFLRPLWTRGRTLGRGLWVASQRPAYIPGHAYSEAHHLFLFRQRDERDRKRLAEIAGSVDKRMVSELVAGLPDYHALYVRIDGRYAIIGP